MTQARITLWTRIFWGSLAAILFFLCLLDAQKPSPDGVSCTVETLTAPHGASQHGPMVSEGSYRAEAVIDPGVYFCVDGAGVTHATPFRPVRNGTCRRK